MSLVLSALTLISLTIVWRRFQSLRPTQSVKTVTIVVLGDIERSPRMSRHVERFESHGWSVNIVSDGKGKPHRNRKYYRLWYPPIPQNAPRKLFLLLAPLKILLNAVSLLYILLLWIDVPSTWIIVQNPPSLPTLPIVQLVAFVRNQRLMIDWHNTGYSILSLRLGTQHRLVKLAEWIERTWGQFADLHVFVSQKMQNDVSAQFQLIGKKILLYDRPPATLHRLTSSDRSNFLHNFPPSRPKESKEALLVSSTSWTADEDFSILLQALDDYETVFTSQKHKKLPRLLMCITGKGGALKTAFEDQVRERKWTSVRVWTGWLPMVEYEQLLGSADIGISLHQSSSGFDLPMKVVDMFGCGLPVCALRFSSIDELVLEGKNGHLFSTPPELASLLSKLLSDYPSFPSELDVLRAGIKEGMYGVGDGQRKWRMWEEEWDETIGRTLDIVQMESLDPYPINSNIQ
ncbi:glycosyltransferase family 33 protein [Atractiella rhizophila]|nr:glycosyltransferase family 33 protein [Atractiella rhizophila]